MRTLSRAFLSKQEYCGDTVNFRTTTKSFKNKRKIACPQEDWQIFENTHPAIVSREVYALVQELRRHRRRPTKSGIVSTFSGLLYCVDCGEKLYYSATGNGKREQANFFCSTYRKNSDVCSAHYIRDKVVMEATLESMRRVFSFVQIFEKEFAHAQMARYGEEQRREFVQRQRKLSKAQARVKEIDSLIQRLYEDNASGKLPDERYATMSLAYEEEQRGCGPSIPEMERHIETETDKAEGLQRFIDKVKRITQPVELTSEMAHEFIQKIVVYAPRYLDGQRVQVVDIHYNGVGVIRGFSPEDVEAAFQEHIKSRKRAKTA